MSEFENDDLLRHLDPARKVELPEPDELEPARIRAAAGGARRQGPRRRLALAVAATVLVTGGTAAAILLRTAAPNDPAPVLCFAEADLESRAIDVGLSDGLAEERCGSLWQSGTLGGASAVPDLIACVLDSGALGIFPGPEAACADLGLPLAVDLETLDPLVSLSAQLRDFTLSRPCPEPTELMDHAARVLGELELTDWDVVARTQPSADRPCGSPAIEADSQVVFIVPVPEPPS